MAEKPAWLSYLESNRVDNKSEGRRDVNELFGFSAPAATPFERLQRQEQAGAIGAEFIAGEPVAAQPKPGLLSRALDVITFLPSVATSAVKEFIYDPIANLATPGTTDKVSIKEFMNNVKERKFAQEQFSFLQYEKDAPLWEKALKQVGGLGIDILSTGGLGGGVRVASALGRKATAMTVEGAAKDAFLRAAKQLDNEATEDFLSRAGRAGQAAMKSEEQLAAEAADFGAKAALAFQKGRSRGVAELFEDTFGNGKEMFFSLPKEVQGGLRVQAFGKTLANWNAGGYLVDDVSRALGLPELASTADKAIRTFQGFKNAARAGNISTPVVAQALNGINSFLNKVGGQSETWQKYLKSIVEDGAEEDSIRAFKGFSEGVRTIQDLRNIRVQFVQGTKDFLRDAGRLEKSSPEVYQKAIAFMKDPASLKIVDDTADDVTIAARAFAEKHRAEYDRYFQLLRENGFDVRYMEEYMPLFMVAPKDAAEMAKVMGPGPRGIPGPGYRPEKERVAFMKDKIDPVTKRPVIDPVTNEVMKEPMTSTEAKNFLIAKGRKDLADKIVDDPLLQLAQYSTNVSRLLANKKVLEDLVRQGILVRSGTLQVALDPTRLETTLARFSPKQISNAVEEELSTPGRMGEYITKLNDDLELAARTGDEALRADVNDRVEALINALTAFDKRLYAKLKKAAAQSDEIEVQKIRDEQAFLRQQQVALGERRRGVRAEPANLLQDLGERAGIEYRQIGSTAESIGETFYLPQEFAGLAGEKALIESIERRMLLRNNDKGAAAEFMASIDQYTQFFRTSATFGRLIGFVLRNGYGAVQNNFMIAGSTGADHKIAAEIARTRVITDWALGPLGQLNRADLATKRVDKLIKDGRLTESQAKALRDDIQNLGIVQTSTVDRIRDEVLEGLLSKKRIDDNVTYWDAYTAARDEGNVYDRYTILPAMQGLNADDDSVLMLGVDPERIVVRTDRLPEERKTTQRIMEGILNFGVGPDTPLIGRAFTAEVAGRNIVIRPTQATRNANQLLEEMVRTAPIITGLRKFGNTESGRRSSGLLMKAAQFDYSDLTDAERGFFRRVLPFWTYTKNNVPAQFRVLLSDPTRIQRNLQAWDAVSNIVGDEEGNAIVLPSYIGQMYGFAINDDYRKQLMEKSPTWLAGLLANPLAFRPESPALDIERYTLTGGAFGAGPVLEQVASSSNPLGKAFLQLLLNQNLTTKREYTADDSLAPNWAQLLDSGLKAASAGKLSLGVRPDPDTGDMVMSGAALDFIKTLLPTTGMVEKTIIPSVEILSRSVTGNQEPLSPQEERAVSNFLSTFGGFNVITLTEKTQMSENYNRIRTRKDNVSYIASQQNIDPGKVSSYVSQLLRNGLDPVADRELIMQELEFAREQGMFAPDYLSAPEE